MSAVEITETQQEVCLEEVPRQDVVQEIDRIAKRHHGHIQADHILEASKTKGTALYVALRWDDESGAAMAWRRDEAHRLMCLYKKVKEIRESHEGRPTIVGKGHVRRFVNLVRGDGYRDRETVLASKTSRKIFIANALSELKSWCGKYADVHELKTLSSMITKALKAFAK